MAQATIDEPILDSPPRLAGWLRVQPDSWQGYACAILLIVGGLAVRLLLVRSMSFPALTFAPLVILAAARDPGSSPCCGPTSSSHGSFSGTIRT